MNSSTNKTLFEKYILEFKSFEADISNQVEQLHALQDELREDWTKTSNQHHHNGTNQSARLQTVRQNFASIQSILLSFFLGAQSVLTKMHEVASADIIERQQTRRCQEILSTLAKQKDSILGRITGLIEAKEAHLLLLSNDSTSVQIGKGSRQAETLYMTERQMLDSSMGIATESLNLARSAKDSLLRQTVKLKGVRSRGVAMLTQHIPELDGLLTRISKVELRNRIVLACVCGFCMLSLMVYVHRRSFT